MKIMYIGSHPLNDEQKNSLLAEGSCELEERINSVRLGTVEEQKDFISELKNEKVGCLVCSLPPEIMTNIRKEFSGEILLPSAERIIDENGNKAFSTNGFERITEFSFECHSADYHDEDDAKEVVSVSRHEPTSEQVYALPVESSIRTMNLTIPNSIEEENGRDILTILKTFDTVSLVCSPKQYWLVEALKDKNVEVIIPRGKFENGSFKFDHYDVVDKAVYKYEKMSFDETKDFLENKENSDTEKEYSSKNENNFERNDNYFDDVESSR